MNATSTTPTRQSEATPFALPARSLEGVGKRPFGIYIHVPFCATRCGYCDFNTYTAG
ncbi:MAG: coproporphyrinogen III oxidase, partial [Rhodococcus sp.]|nr:coproporphyrinogen III oxidase [Rhodococcus sp. (in: high G+C Gram-positive bacteria)]